MELLASQSQSQSQTTGENPLVAEVRYYITEKLKRLPEISDSPAVDRVPDRLRLFTPAIYTPLLVAIGPLCHNDPSLKPMEELKLRFLKEFYTKMNNNIDAIISFLVNYGIERIRKFYKDRIMAMDIHLFEMMILDSVFIVQIFLKKKRKDPMFDNYWLFRDLLHDLLLIENQIPLLIPYIIYNNHYCQSVDGEEEQNHTDFFNLAANFFEEVMMASGHQRKFPTFSDLTLISQKPRHFVEYFFMAYFPQVPSVSNPASQRVSSLLKSGAAATASRLLEYGVKFEVSKSTTTSLVDIQFKPKDGILTIPQIKVNELTRFVFFNLLAFEHCQQVPQRYVTDYMIFMDSLIDTTEDVNILIGAGIIQDDFHDPELVSIVFNNFYKEVVTENRHFCFAKQFRELNDYRRDWWHQWKARWYKWKLILKRDYFNSPWTTISFIAAVILLGLTIVQTVCSIYQSKGIQM